MSLLDDIINVANEVHRHRCLEAEVVFLAGSFVRGEDTSYSDLDLVVVFRRLPNAYRESFYFQGYPVEVFAHDPETLNYFITDQHSSGICVMAQMVMEGIELPELSLLSQQLKQLAAAVINSPPPQLSEEKLRQMRYTITDLIDDLRQPRSHDEAIATGTLLYDALANAYLRMNDHWMAKGKSIPKKLKIADPGFCSHFCDSFQELFARGQPEKVIALAEEILKPLGGFLFEGYQQNASKESRRPLQISLPHFPID